MGSLVPGQLAFTEGCNIRREILKQHRASGPGNGVGVGVKLLLGEDVSGSLAHQLRGGVNLQTLL